MGITNNAALQLTANSLSAGFCHESMQATHEEFTNKITAPHIGASFVASQTEPTGTDFDKLWLKLNSSDVPVGWYYHNGSAWTEASVSFTAPTGSYGSASQIPSLTVDANGRVTAASNNTLTATGVVGALRGTISDGGTIPLPSGFTEAQCTWSVGVGSYTATHGDHNSNHNMVCTADANRVVSMTVHGGVGTSATANYIIIGIK